MKKDKYLYEKNMGRSYFQKDWDDKKRGKMDQRKKRFVIPIFPPVCD